MPNAASHSHMAAADAAASLRRWRGSLAVVLGRCRQALDGGSDGGDIRTDVAVQFGEIDGGAN